MNHQGVSAFKLKSNLIADFTSAKSKNTCNVVESLNGYLIKTGDIRNFVTKSAYQRLAKLLRAYDERPATKLKDLWNDSYLILPIESHVICIAAGGIAALQIDCGLRSFLSERTLLLKRNQLETVLLHSTINFVWGDNVNHGRFEELILQLLVREPGVNWARQVGLPNASDGGRDIIADWWLGPTRVDKVTENEVLERRRVVVQCKAFANSINLSKIPNVPQILDLHDSSGYCLVAYPQVTPQVVDYLTKVPAKRGVLGRLVDQDRDRGKTSLELGCSQKIY